jgi:hypothetical protein
MSVAFEEVSTDEGEAVANRGCRFEEVDYHPRLMPANAIFPFLHCLELGLSKNKFEQIANIGPNDVGEQVNLLADE